MPEQLMQFKATAPLKALMTLLVVAVLFASWFVLRWYIGNTIAEYFHPEQHPLETAQMAVGLAPNDPLTHWRLGTLVQKEFPPDQIPVVVAEFEKAVSLSPNDYRFWMDFGTALEQAGEFAKAEQALREAVKLAPSYAYPHWYLGNLLIRTERYPEGFEELRRASDANDQFRAQLFSLAWQLNKDDFDALRAALGTAPAVHADFSRYLVQRGRYDEGLRLWNTLSETNRKENRVSADLIIESLVNAHRYHQAMEVWNQVAPGPGYNAQLGRVLDPGFEGNLAHGPGAVFGWQEQSGSQVQIGIDAGQGHNSSRSLRVYFQVRSHLDTINVSQLVPVSPNTDYAFECYLKTDRLESAETPRVGITNAADDSWLAQSQSAPSGTTDWQRISLAFKTGANIEAIRVKIVRNSCPDSPVCPIFGTVWYDDFDLNAGK
jgi:Flp pilus assembly protein TadD